MIQPLEDMMGLEEDKNRLNGKPPGTFFIYPCEKDADSGYQPEYRSVDN